MGVERLDLVAVQHELAQLVEVLEAVDARDLIPLEVEDAKRLQPGQMERRQLGDLIESQL